MKVDHVISLEAGQVMSINHVNELMETDTAVTRIPGGAIVQHHIRVKSIGIDKQEVGDALFIGSFYVPLSELLNEQNL